MKNLVSFLAQSKVLFNSPKPQAVQFAMIKREASKPHNKKKLYPAEVWYFYVSKDLQSAFLFYQSLNTKKW